jgi:Lrp/AsnC family leucine-responsive transcriptional regulator
MCGEQRCGHAAESSRSSPGENVDQSCKWPSLSALTISIHERKLSLYTTFTLLLRTISLSSPSIVGKYTMIELDSIDYRILAAVSRNGRISMLDLAELVGLSPTPCGRRIRRLEEAGIILGYAAQISPQALGANISVLVSIRLLRHGTEGNEQFLNAIAKRPEITECLMVTGSVDYILRIWVRDIDALGTFVRDVLQSIPAVAETTTMVILKQDKNSQILRL